MRSNRKYTAICKRCGKEFTVYCTQYEWEHNKYKRYCSDCKNYKNTIKGKHPHTAICKRCGKEFTVYCTQYEWEHNKYKRYCSKECANIRIHSEITKNKIKESLIKHYQDHPIVNEYKYICEKCGKEFTLQHPIKKNRKIYCNECKRNVKHYKNITNENSILDVSKRTASKILKRMNVGCAICGWNESSCDIHHIIPKKDGGSNNNDNLIIVCPNCHRVLHTTNKYTIEFLKKLSITNINIDWIKFYHPSN